jgi:hypothetical protein
MIPYVVPGRHEIRTSSGVTNLQSVRWPSWQIANVLRELTLS